MGKALPGPRSRGLSHRDGRPGPVCGSAASRVHIEALIPSRPRCTFQLLQIVCCDSVSQTSPGNATDRGEGAVGKRLRAWVLSARVLTQNVRDLPASTKFSPPRPADLTLELGQPTVSTHQLCGRSDPRGWLPPVAGVQRVGGVAGCGRGLWMWVGSPPSVPGGSVLSAGLCHRTDDLEGTAECRVSSRCQEV